MDDVLSIVNRWSQGLSFALWWGGVVRGSASVLFLFACLGGGEVSSPQAPKTPPHTNPTQRIGNQSGLQEGHTRLGVSRGSSLATPFYPEARQKSGSQWCGSICLTNTLVSGEDR